jgi:hypothetical protein
VENDRVLTSSNFYDYGRNYLLKEAKQHNGNEVRKMSVVQYDDVYDICCDGYIHSANKKKQKPRYVSKLKIKIADKK